MGKVVYKDIALGAAESAVITTPTELENFSNSDAVTTAGNLPGIATCELNGWGLSHDYQARDKHTLAFWSKEKSGADCLFSSAPAISISFPFLYTSTGLTIRFAAGSYDFCKQCRVRWYKDGVLLYSENYTVDNPVFVINKTVEGFNGLSFAFQETNQPGKRCKIEKIIIGVIREFERDELKSVSAIHEVDLISDTVPFNVLDVSLHSKEDIDYIFQRKQPVEAYEGENLIGTYYIEKGRRTSRSAYSISCQDVIGLLDLIACEGKIYFEDTPLQTVLADVFGSVVTFDIDPAFENSTLRGFVEPDISLREALGQIAFAIGAVVDTSGTAKVKLFPIPQDEGEIPARKTYTGGAVETTDKVTEVTVTAYRFFDEEPTGEDEYIELNGAKYRYYTDTKHAVNPDAFVNDPENKVKFIGKYLCNLDNAQERADAIMEYYRRRNKYSFKYVYDGELPAESRSVFIPWLEKKHGNITKMTISLSGITVCSAEMLLND